MASGLRGVHDNLEMVKSHVITSLGAPVDLPDKTGAHVAYSEADAQRPSSGNAVTIGS
jgi:hypothetical protein